MGFLALFGITLVGPIDLEHIGAIEGVVKCLVLVYYYITFALLLLVLTIVILLVCATLGPLAVLTGATFSFALNKVEYRSAVFSIEISYLIQPYHGTILDLDAPRLDFACKFGEIREFPSYRS